MTPAEKRARTRKVMELLTGLSKVTDLNITGYVRDPETKETKGYIVMLIDRDD